MILKKIVEFLRDELLIEDDITMDTLLEDLNIDSLDVVELIMNLEDEFEISVPDDALEHVRTIGDVVEYIKDLMD